MRQYELIVLGSGPAGHHAAIQAAKLGRRVAIVERLACVGGVCINTGTIPSKTLREAVLYLSGFQQRGLYGHSYRVKQTITIQDLMFRCHHVIQKENDVYRSQFARNSVDVLEGHASFVDPHTIKIESEGPAALIRAERFVIATGTVPAVSADVPVDGTAIIDADGIFDLPNIPGTMLVVGAGVIGMEYACMFSTLGAMVTVVDGRKRLLEFAAGDVVGFPSLASVSMEQGRVASANSFGIATVTMPALFPYGLYTIPEISFVGRTEEELTTAGVPYEVGMAHYREIARGQIIGDTTGRLKLIFHSETGALLGVHVIGEGATELIHIGQAVMALGGTVRYFVDHVFNYPTLAECYKVAALAGLNKLGAARAASIGAAVAPLDPSFLSGK